MDIYRQTTPKPSFLVEGKSQSDTCLYTGNCIPRSFSKERIPPTYSAGLQASPSKRTYSMGWLTKLIKPKSDETKFVPISQNTKPYEIEGQKDARLIPEHIVKENVGLPSKVLQNVASPTTPVDNVYYTMKLKIYRLSDYATSWQELAKSPSNTSIANKPTKRKADELGQDVDIQTKRLRESVDDNNNQPQLVDNNNNLEDDKLDAEVAMYLENSGPPTIREIVPEMEPAYTGYQAESPSPWLRCIEGCYHSYRSPLGITREPREGAIKILNPWPCLYRNTKFGELKKVGGLDVDRAPTHWRKRSEN